METFKYIITVLVICMLIMAVSSIAGSLSAPGTVLGSIGGYVLWGLFGFTLLYSFIKSIRSSL